jgi:hypothetical protein
MDARTRTAVRWLAIGWVRVVVVSAVSAGPAGGLAIGLIGVGALGAWGARRATHAFAVTDDASAPPRRPRLVQRLRARIDPPVPGEPDDWIVVADTLFAEGPMVQSAIEGAGVRAVLREVSGLPAHGMERYQVVVQRRDLEVALEIVDELSRR